MAVLTPVYFTVSTAVGYHTFGGNIFLVTNVTISFHTITALRIIFILYHFTLFLAGYSRRIMCSRLTIAVVVPHGLDEQAVFQKLGIKALVYSFTLA